MRVLFLRDTCRGIMDLLNLMMTRRTIRQYGEKDVPMSCLKKIVTAGEWSPSVHNIQPWRFIVVQNKNTIKKLSKILSEKSKELLSGFNIIVKETAKLLLNAPVVVVVYNSCELSERVKKFEEPYYGITRISEYESVAAAIENMLLMAHSLGLGTAWLTSPLFCEKEISDFFSAEGTLLALMTIGYPKFGEKIKRKNRINNSVVFYEDVKGK